MELDHDKIRRFANAILVGATKQDMIDGGFIRDANDEYNWEQAAKDPEAAIAGDPDSEMVLGITDMAVIDDILSRIKPVAE